MEIAYISIKLVCTFVYSVLYAVMQSTLPRIYIPGMLHAYMFDLCTQINIIHNITRKQLSVRMR
jgi:hypothetical protein